MTKKIVDVLVVGSGIGGLSSGLFLSKRGFDTLICEKNNFYGGTTAWSQGMIWIPNTHHAKNAGIKDRIREKEFYVKPSATKNEKNNYTKRKRKKDIEKAKELEFRRKIAMKTKGL